MDVDSCIVAYNQLAKEIFPKESFISGSKLGKHIKGFTGKARFDAGVLETRVKEYISNELKIPLSGDEGSPNGKEDTMFDFEALPGSEGPKCKVFVCTTQKSTEKKFRLRNYRSKAEPSTHCTIWQACRATSAAPLIFDPITFGHPISNTYVDGGLGMNNPIEALIDEAEQIWDCNGEHRVGCIISIGTGVPPTKSIGDINLTMLGTLVRMSTDTQETARRFGKQMKRLKEHDLFCNSKYFRFNVPEGVGGLPLEEWIHFELIDGTTNDYLNDIFENITTCARAMYARPGRPSNGDTVASEIPYLCAKFHGRDKEIEKLRIQLSPEKSGRKGVVLWGLPGIGKTQIAIRYQGLFRAQYSSIIWVDATTRESAIDCFSDILPQLGKRPNPTSPPEFRRRTASHEKEILSAVKSWLMLRSKGNWLLLIDSYDDAESFDVRQFLPECGHGNILITTTRSEMASELDMDSIEVGAIDSAAGSKILLDKLSQERRSNEDYRDAEMVVRKLDGIPLSIEQAGAFLSKTRVPIQNYIPLYEANYVKLSGFKPGRLQWSYEKNRSISTCIGMLYEALSKEDADAANAIHLLNLSSLFGPAPIPISVLTTARSFDGEKATSAITQLLREEAFLLLAIGRLQETCLAKSRYGLDGCLDSYSIHNVVRRWVLEKLTAKEREEYAIIVFNSVGQLLGGAGAWDPSTPNYNYLKYNTHTRSSLNLIRDIKYVSRESIAVPDGKFFQRYGSVASHYAKFCYSQNLLQEAREMFRAATEYDMLREGEAWPISRGSLRNVEGFGLVYWASGDFEKASETFESLLGGCSRVLGEDDEMTLKALSQLRAVQDRQAALTEHQRRAYRASTYRKRSVAPDFNYPSYGEGEPPAGYDASVEMTDEEWSLVEAVRESTELFGVADMETLVASQKLARFYNDRGRLSAAIRLFQKLWVTSYKVYGYHHPFVLEAVFDLARYYKGINFIAWELQGSLKIAHLWASRGGHLELLRFLLQEGANLSLRDEFGNTSLHLSAWSGNSEMVQLLVGKGAYANDVNKYKVTPLHIAAFNGCDAIVKQLLESGADAKAVDWDGWTALHCGVSGGHEAVTERLLEARADVKATGNDGLTPLHRAARGGHDTVVKRLLEAGADAKAANKDRITPLHLAAKGGYGAVVKQLLEAGADSRAANRDGVTSLHLAASGGHELPEWGAAPKVKDTRGQSAPSYAAVDTGHRLVISLLLQNGDNIEAHTMSGCTPLHYAALAGKDANIELLLDRGADLNARSNVGSSMMHCAVGGGSESALRLLLQKGMNPDTRNKQGSSPLLAASRNGHTSIVELLLLTNNIDINACDNDGDNPFISAAARGHADIVKLLLKEPGLDLGFKNQAGDTALSAALEAALMNKRRDAVEILLSLAPSGDAQDEVVVGGRKDVST